MIVMKFGGTSVGNAEAMRRVGEIVKQALPRKPVVVVSAVSKMTDRLLEAARLAQRRAKPHEELLDPIKEKHREILSELRLSRRLLDTDLGAFCALLEEFYRLSGAPLRR